MSEPKWTDIVIAMAAITTPLVVAGFGWALTRRQSRNELLLGARIDYYRQLAPELNRLMTYMLFIGSWRDVTPPQIIEVKRKLDAAFFVAAPLFSEQVGGAYQRFMSSCFTTFGAWGADAKIRSSPYRRRRHWRGAAPWDPAWNACFELDEAEPVTSDDLRAVRTSHDDLVAALVRDLSMNRAREAYTTAHVVSNAGAQIRTVAGASEHES